MDTSESKVHSFIVKLWLDEADEKSGKPVWHGYITHVPDGERTYLKKLSEVVDFIKRYLDGTVTKRGLLDRLRFRFRL